MTQKETLGVWFVAVSSQSGADVFTERLAAGLERQGVKTIVTWLPLRAEYAPWTVPIPKPPGWVNVVHVNSWLHPHFFPKDLPVLTTFHSCVHDDALEPFKSRAQRKYHRRWIRRIEAQNIDRASIITAVSQYTSDQAKRVFGNYEIHVIYNGIPLNGAFQPVSRESPNHPFRLLYVGNWSLRKGVDLLPAIMKRLGSDFELHYTADRQENHLRYSLPKNCHCIGRLSSPRDLALAYQYADALLFPSRLEGFGLVAAEAMACGLPVIAAQVSSLPEVVANGETGFLCSQHHPKAFAEASRSIASDIGLWIAMRRATHRRVELLFNEDDMLLKYIVLYRSLVSEF